MDPIEFYFDYASPYSYLALTQFPTLGAEVRPVPVPVLEVMKLVNNSPTSVTCPPKRAYIGRDLGRWAARYGVDLGPTDMSKLDRDLLLRVSTAAVARGDGPAVVERLFKAVWGKDGDPSPQGVATLLTEAGVAADELLAAAEAPETVQALAAAAKAAADHGVFGVPTFRFRDELFFGNDRLDFLRDAVAAAREAA